MISETERRESLISSFKSFIIFFNEKFFFIFQNLFKLISKLPSMQREDFEFYSKKFSKEEKYLLKMKSFKRITWFLLLKNYPVFF